MRTCVLQDAEAVASRAAAHIATLAREAATQRRRFIVAVSGGNTPWRMYRKLAAEDVPWNIVHIVQVDERVAPCGSPERNFEQLHSNLIAHVPLPATQVHAMPVEDIDLAAGAQRYGDTLAALAGSPPVLDLVQLGLGVDGHTASLVPNDAALDVTDADVALTGVYEGHRRMTLTLPLINRARRILWLVTGSSKARALARVHSGDATLPAGRIDRERALVMADRAAAVLLEGGSHTGGSLDAWP